MTARHSSLNTAYSHYVSGSRVLMSSVQLVLLCELWLHCWSVGFHVGGRGESSDNCMSTDTKLTCCRLKLKCLTRTTSKGNNNITASVLSSVTRERFEAEVCLLNNIIFFAFFSKFHKQLVRSYLTMTALLADPQWQLF